VLADDGSGKNGFRSVYWTVLSGTPLRSALASPQLPSTFLEAIDHFLISMNSNQSALSIFELVDRRMAQGVQNRRRWMKMSKAMDARATGGERLCFLNGSRVRANGCLFGLPNNFRTVEAVSPNKHLEAMSSLPTEACLSQEAASGGENTLPAAFS
jgi:hypothetical protein